MNPTPLSAEDARMELRFYIDRYVEDGGDRDACYEALAALATTPDPTPSEDVEEAFMCVGRDNCTNADCNARFAEPCPTPDDFRASDRALSQPSREALLEAALVRDVIRATHLKRKVGESFTDWERRRDVEVCGVLSALTKATTPTSEEEGR